jgi:hypothetical protein
MAIKVTDCKLVYGSYTGTSDTNIMGYWTTPLVGPDGGTIQSDIWKLRAATANINLTSHSGSSVLKDCKLVFNIHLLYWLDQLTFLEMELFLISLVVIVI